MLGGRDLLVDNKTIYNFELLFFSWFEWIIFLVIILYLIGFLQEKPISVLEINFAVKILIAFYLIYRFNSFRKGRIVFTELDRKVVFSSGVFILVIAFADIIDAYIEKIRAIIDPYFARVMPFTASDLHIKKPTHNLTV